MTPIIETDNLSFEYNSKHNILNEICISIQSGQLITLLGPNGVGKSTLLNCLTGLISPTSGKVFLHNKDIFKYSKKEIAHSIAYVPQRTDVSFDYSVLDFVVMGRTSHLSIFAVPNHNDYCKAEQALNELGICDLKFRSISELSGGEQQKVIIARAIAQEPELIIMDEPTSALDYGNQIKVLRLIKQLSSSNFAVLVTTHNPEHPLLLNSDVWILNKKGSVVSGSSDQLISEDVLSELYETDIYISDSKEFGRKVCVIRSLK